MCKLVFELRDRTEDFILFEPDSEPVRYEGERELTDYEIETEKLQITRNDRNYSRAEVAIVFRHRASFHTIHTFVQSMVVLVVVAATFLFDLNDFSDRVMVNSVLLLVMATINFFVQSQVPSTAYNKLVDVWLLFCVIMIVLAIIFHTVIALVFGQNAQIAPRETHGGGAGFKRIRTPSGSLENEKSTEDEDQGFGAAKIANFGALGLWLLILFIFNIAFWVIALTDYNKSSDQILEERIQPIK